VIVSDVLQQHADDAMALAGNRQALTRAAYAKLPRLRRSDQRLGAHLDGLRIAGRGAESSHEGALESPSPAVVFVSMVRALEDKDKRRLERLIDLVQGVPCLVDGLLFALGWVERSQLQGTVAGLLRDREGFRRAIGVAACAIHRVDPGLVSGRHLQDSDPAVRARSFRAAGELGLADLEPSCEAALRGDDNAETQFWAARSAVLLGDRRSGLDLLAKRAVSPGGRRVRSFRLALQAMSMDAAHNTLKELARDPRQIRTLIEGSGIAGDPRYVPWLIERMTELSVARVAGEAFSLITGADLVVDALDCPAPENFESGPNDDPADPNVDMDPDDGLPWPDGPRIEKWWAANESRFQKGTRHFMGAPVTREHCIDMLKNAYQRQRILAAHYLCLLEPGTPLFNTSAPAWRQERLLAKMA
jgi:uncharacterized protein (TIGR02270 family)